MKHAISLFDHSGVMLEFESNKARRLFVLLEGLSLWISGDMEWRGEEGERWMTRFDEGEMRYLYPAETVWSE